jgi:hypothetical protein
MLVDRLQARQGDLAGALSQVDIEVPGQALRPEKVENRKTKVKIRNSKIGNRRSKIPSPQYRATKAGPDRPEKWVVWKTKPSIFLYFP